MNSFTNILPRLRHRPARLRAHTNTPRSALSTLNISDNANISQRQTQTNARTPKHAMDCENVFIGHNTANGRPIPTPTSKKQTRTPHDKPLPKPKGTVKIMFRDEVIAERELVTVIRFSRVAAGKFPKPSTLNTHNTATADAHVTATTSISTADVDKELELDDQGFWPPPSSDAFKELLDWMDTVKTTERGVKLEAFSIAEAEVTNKCGLKNLVDLRAASLLLGIRPYPERLTLQAIRLAATTTLSLDDLVYIHEHLPIDDPVMTNAINSHLQHRDIGAYSDNELEDFCIYVHTADRALYHRFCAAENAYQKKKAREAAAKGGLKGKDVKLGDMKTGETSGGDGKAGGVEDGRSKDGGRKHIPDDEVLAVRDGKLKEDSKATDMDEMDHKTDSQTTKAANSPQATTAASAPIPTEAEATEEATEEQNQASRSSRRRRNRAAKKGLSKEGKPGPGNLRIGCLLCSWRVKCGELRVLWGGVLVKTVDGKPLTWLCAFISCCHVFFGMTSIDFKSFGFGFWMVLSRLHSLRTGRIGHRSSRPMVTAVLRDSNVA